MLHAQLRPLHELDDEAIDAWRDLAARALEPNPFFEPAFTMAAARHLDARGVSLLVAEDDGRWLACMPVRPARWHGVRALVAWKTLYTFLGTPLLDADDAEDALTALLAAAAEDAPGGLLAVEDVHADARFREALSDASLRTVVEQEHERALFDPAAPGDGLALSPKHLRELARKRRRMEDHLGAPLETVDLAGDPGAVMAFLELEAATWKGRDGTALLSSEEDAAFFQELCWAFGAEGRLRMTALRSGERIAAMACNLSAPPGLFAFKIAFDEELRAFSPGVQLMLDIGRSLADGPEQWIDSCADPGNDTLNRLWSGRRPLTTALLGSSRRAGFRDAGLRSAANTALAARRLLTAG